MKKIVTLAAAWALPVFAFAQVRSVQQAAGEITTIINSVLVPMVFAIAFLVFIWGVFTYFIAGGHDAEKQEQGRNLILYSVLGFFVMISVWGLVNILVGTFSLQNAATPIPVAPGPRS